MVTLGLDSKFSNFSTPTRNLSQASYMVAPLWFSNVSQHLVNSNVSWEEHTEDQSFILEFASNAVGTYTQDSFGKMVEFMPKWALVVNWNVSLSPENATEVCNNFNVIQCEAGVPRDQCDRDKKFLGLLCDPGVDDLDESLFLGVSRDTPHQCHRKIESLKSNSEFPQFSLLPPPSPSPPLSLPLLSPPSPFFPPPIPPHVLPPSLPPASLSLRLRFSWCWPQIGRTPMLSISMGAMRLSDLILTLTTYYIMIQQSVIAWATTMKAAPV